MHTNFRCGNEDNATDAVTLGESERNIYVWRKISLDSIKKVDKNYRLELLGHIVQTLETFNSVL